jgi:EF-P beta-lysylation protein EpmB
MAEILAIKDDSVEATLDQQIPWQQAMKRAIRSGAELCQLLDLSPELSADQAETDFPVFAPREYVRRMQVGDPQDPLLRQVLGARAEVVPGGEGRFDAVGDLLAERAPGLLVKYDRRALLVTTGACAVHCRYCFRRHFPYDTVPKHKLGWQQSLDLIAADPGIDEVILSGGDPLTLADASLRWLVEQIHAIKHVARIRIHTRVPVVIPQRVCEPLLAWVSASRLPLFFVLHFNHAQELDETVVRALQQLRRAGAVLLNQAVLLRGVNDSIAAQRQLCLKLVNHQVLPYYLHQLDRVHGTLHFEVPDSEALAISRGLQAELPGYAVPKLVREIAGKPSKTVVTAG